MTATLNIGNTHLLFGIWQQDRLVFRCTISTNLTRTQDEYAVQLESMLSLHHVDSSMVTGGIISSVVPVLTPRLKQALEQVFSAKFLIVEPGIKTGLSIRIDSPNQLGSELVCAAVAALDYFTGALIVIHMDTAISITAINSQKQLLGGAIFASPHIALEALVQKSAQLSQVNLEVCPQKVIGTNTISSMQSGFILGTACMLDGILQRFQQELAEPATIVSTGNIPSCILQACSCKIHYQENLILRGLLLIYKKNMG